MKGFHYFLLFLFAGFFLYSQEQISFDEGTPSWEADDSIQWIHDQNPDYRCQRFISIEGDYEHIFSSNFRTPGLDGDIAFGQGGFSVNYTAFLTCFEGISAGIGYERTFIDWDENPFFARKRYNDLTFNINGFSKRWRCIDLKAGFGANLDTREMDLGSYTRYHYLGWGRYELCCASLPAIGINLGVVGYAGLKKNQVYPLAGLDFRLLCNRLKVNLVYPVNLSVEYFFSDCFSFEAAGKIWRSRHRLSKSEPVPMGYYEYRNAGIEFGINYQYGEFFSANLHVGGTLGGGNLVVSDSSNRDIQHNKFHAAPYIGGELIARF